MKNIPMSSDWLRAALLPSEISRSIACLVLYGKQRSQHHKHLYSQSSLKRKRFVLSITGKNKDAHDIVFQVICKSVVSQLNIVFLI